jgi:hypothetical protein
MGGNVCTILEGDRGDVDKAFAEADSIFETPSAPKVLTRAI